MKKRPFKKAHCGEMPFGRHYSPLEENVASPLIVNTPKKVFQWISTTQMAIALFQRWH